MNNVVLIGRLTHDPELRHVGETPVTNFQLAVDRPYNTDEADFLPCEAWRSAAENLCKFMKKGKQISIRGWVKADTYEKDGERIKNFRIVAEQIKFLDYGDSGEQNASSSQRKRKSGSKPFDISDDDLPF